MQTARAVANFADLAVLADGVLLDRGHLGMHIAPHKITVLQKRLIHACNVLGKARAPASLATKRLCDHEGL